MPYYGNKRTEVENIISNLIDLTDIEYIVEPYCGSCAISYYISTLYEGKKYILNDNNIFLKEMYEIMLSKKKIKKFEDEFEELATSIDSKERYKEITKPKTLMAWFIKNKIYHIRPGMFYMTGRKYKTTIDLKTFPIYDFFINNEITFRAENAMNIYNEYKSNSKAMIFLDPPYMQSCNDFYSDHSCNIYEYLYENNINDEKAFICLILENMWIVRLLFQNNNVVSEYDKVYQNNHNKTTHIIILNWY